MSEEFDQVGYFKDEVGNRVFQIRSAAPIDQETTREMAEKLAHTVGHVTIAFIFEHNGEDMPDYVTLSSDFTEANANILDNAPAWRWWFRRSPNGETTLVDCVAAPGNTICKAI